MEFIKNCKCCGRTFTHRAWDQLLFIGIQSFEPHFKQKLELRNCWCGTTLSREIDPKELVVDGPSVVDSEPK